MNLKLCKKVIYHNNGKIYKIHKNLTSRTISDKIKVKQHESTKCSWPLHYFRITNLKLCKKVIYHNNGKIYKIHKNLTSRTISGKIKVKQHESTKCSWPLHYFRITNLKLCKKVTYHNNGKIYKIYKNLTSRTISSKIKVKQHESTKCSWPLHYFRITNLKLCKKVIYHNNGKIYKIHKNLTSRTISDKIKVKQHESTKCSWPLHYFRITNLKLCKKVIYHNNGKIYKIYKNLTSRTISSKIKVKQHESTKCSWPLHYFHKSFCKCFFK